MSPETGINDKRQTEVSRWDDPEQLLKVTRNEEVLRALSVFLNVTQKRLVEVFRLRATPQASLKIPDKGNGGHRDVTYRFGYNTFEQPKSSGKGMRQISDPAPAIKEVQKELLLRLRQVPHTIAVTGGEPGMGIRENVTRHVRNSYTVTMDIKNAFPSVTGERVYANLRGFIERQLTMNFPHLAVEERELFMYAVVALMIKDDQLPQGAPTSTHLLNLVLARVDSDIFRSINSEKLGLHLPQYTRYVDDITISWRCFSDFITPWRIAGQMQKRLTSVLEPNPETSPEEQEKQYAALPMETLIAEISQNIDELKDNTGGIRHQSEIDNTRKKLAVIRGLILKLKACCWGVDIVAFEKMDGLVGELDVFSAGLKATDKNPVTAVINEVGAILRKNGFRPKDSKTRVWTPNSGTARQITGIIIGPQGKLSLPRETMDKFQHFAYVCGNCEMDRIIDALRNLEPHKFAGKGDKNITADTVSRVLQGIRSFILEVKGTVPKKFEVQYSKARSRFFSTWHQTQGRYQAYS